MAFFERLGKVETQPIFAGKGCFFQVKKNGLVFLKEKPARVKMAASNQKSFILNEPFLNVTVSGYGVFEKSSLNLTNEKLP